MVAAGILQKGEEATLAEYQQFMDLAIKELLRCEGHAEMAVRHLGVVLPEDRLQRRAIVANIYGDARLIRKMQEKYADLDLAKQDVIARQIRNAVFGSPEDSVRAAAFLAKVGGWNQASEVNVNMKTVTLHGLLKDSGQVDQFLEMTSHEPGAATAVYSEVLDGGNVALTDSKPQRTLETIEQANEDDCDSEDGEAE